MFDIGFLEILMFGAIALIVLGPEKLPQAARTAGKWYAKIRFTIANVQHEIETELNIAETRQLMQQELDKIKQAESKMQQELAEIRGSVQSMQNSSSHQTTSHQTTEGQHNPIEAIQSSNPTPVNCNKPLENRWFILGDYDRNRRLPSAPLLPNYQADPLLSHQAVQDKASNENSNELIKEQDTSDGEQVL